MSAKLQKAILRGHIEIQNRTQAEVAIRYVDGETGEVAQRQIPPSGSIELCPKLTKKEYVKYSNVKDLIKRGVIRIK
jgi:hypothetical protein